MGLFRNNKLSFKLSLMKVLKGCKKLKLSFLHFLLRFEKMISGMYLGEIARLACMDLVAKKLLFKGQVSEKFKSRNSFLTKFVSAIER